MLKVSKMCEVSYFRDPKLEHDEINYLAYLVSVTSTYQDWYLYGISMFNLLFEIAKRKIVS